jgi:hypothetical protein
MNKDVVMKKHEKLCIDCIAAYSEDDGLVLRSDLTRCMLYYAAVKGKLNGVGLSGEDFSLDLFKYCPKCGREN